MTAHLPQRERFSRRDVEAITRLAGRVLDYWEREFGVPVPAVGRNGDPVYTRQDVDTLLQIRRWLVEERLGREEVRRRLAESTPPESPPEPPAPPAPEPRPDTLQAVQDGLREILTILEKSDKQ